MSGVCPGEGRESLPEDGSSLVPVRKLELVAEGSNSHTPTLGLRRGPVPCAQCHRRGQWCCEESETGACQPAGGRPADSEPRCPLWPGELSDTPPDTHWDLIAATLRAAQSPVPSGAPGKNL